MKTELDIHPNFSDEKAVQFAIDISPTEEEYDGEDLLKFFRVSILGYIPENDSVNELRRMAPSKARELLERIIASGVL